MPGVLVGLYIFYSSQDMIKDRAERKAMFVLYCLGCSRQLTCLNNFNFNEKRALIQLYFVEVAHPHG